MSGYLLTDQERQRFADWLAVQAATNDDLARQMEKIGVPSQILNRTRQEAAAYKIVESALRRTESMTVSRSESPGAAREGEGK